VARQAEIEALTQRALELKRERRAVILAHLYQRPEIQDVGDFVGDSLGLSQQAASAAAELIVFCGVHFMAESAAILSPEKTIILPEPNAGCPMADMVKADDLQAKKRELPGVPVVCYVNSSAAVKAESDICCTSRNAVQVVDSLPGDTVIFVPDRNLGDFVGRSTKKRVIAWDGYCATHDRITAADVRRAKEQHPEALVMVHPECRPEVVDLADEVLSTAGMLRLAGTAKAREFIVGTERGILYQLTKRNPEKRFHLANDTKQYCPNMKKTTLPKLVWALERLQPRITVPEEIRVRAAEALQKMLSVSRKAPG
jgi:quinolinate synthase